MENDVFIKLIHKNHWPDFEDVYRKAGWTVVYKSPAYNESAQPIFTFSTT